MLSSFGVVTPNEGLILSRNAGVLLVGLGIIDRTTRTVMLLSSAVVSIRAK